MIGHMRHGSPPRLLALQSILSPNRRESLPTPSAGVRMTGPPSAALFALGARYRNCMSGPVSVILWLGLVLIGIASMRWGAARAADLLDILRGHWGLPATAGGALMGLATASPEI